MEDKIKESIEKARLISERIQHSETEEGKQVLDEWLSADAKHRKLYERLQQKEHLSPYYMWRHSVNTERAWNDLQRRRGIKPHSRMQTLYRWVGNVAASLLFLAGSYTTYTLWIDEMKTEVVIQTQPFRGNTVQPGKTQAYLYSGDQSLTLTEDMELDAAKGVVVEKNTGDTLYVPTEAVQMQCIVVPRGGEYQLTLEDGTKVWLNAETTLTYPQQFTKARREVEISGEAYFEVAHNSERPFFVHIDGQSIHVVGTSFNVRHYADDKESLIALVEGCVQMEKRTGELLNTLLPGQQCSINHADNSIRTGSFDADKVLAWKNGLFVFNNVSLVAIADQLERWYNVKIEVSPALKKNTYMGTLSRRQDMTAIVQILESTGELKFMESGNGNIQIVPSSTMSK